MSDASPPSARLRIAPALQQDVGYGRARLDGQTRIEMNLSPGDVISIEGARRSAAVVWRSHPGDEGKGIVHLDNVQRSCIEAEVGDEVIITKAATKPANVIHIAVPNVKGLTPPEIEGLARRNLMKRPAIVGDLMVMDLSFGGPRNHFYLIIAKTEPNGIVVIGAETRVEVIPPGTELQFDPIPDASNEGGGM